MKTLGFYPAFAVTVQFSRNPSQGMVPAGEMATGIRFAARNKGESHDVGDRFAVDEAGDTAPIIQYKRYGDVDTSPGMQGVEPHQLRMDLHR